MNLQEAMQELGKVAGESYHGIQQTASRPEGEDEIKNQFDLFIEIDHNPNAEGGSKFVHSCHAETLEVGLRDIKELFEIEAGVVINDNTE